MRGYAFYGFKYGLLKIGYESGKIIEISKIEYMDEANEPNDLTDNVFLQISEYLAGKRKSFDFPFILNGTDFQKRVWKELCRIPYGETRSYKNIAEAIGNPKACRAVGMANNKNPIIFAVPCHRVIGCDGKMVGYACGIDMKVDLLRIEKEND